MDSLLITGPLAGGQEWESCLVHLCYSMRDVSLNLCNQSCCSTWPLQWERQINSKLQPNLLNIVMEATGLAHTQEEGIIQSCGCQGGGASREPSENAASHRLYVTEQPEGHWFVIVSTQAAIIESTDRGLHSRDLLLTDLEFCVPVSRCQ